MAERDSRTERTSVSLTTDMRDGAKTAAEELGMSMNAWLGMAVGRAVRSHRMEREVLEKVLKETFGEQMKLQLEEMEKGLGQP